MHLALTKQQYAVALCRTQLCDSKAACLQVGTQNLHQGLAQSQRPGRMAALAARPCRPRHDPSSYSRPHMGGCCLAQTLSQSLHVLLHHAQDRRSTEAPTKWRPDVDRAPTAGSRVSASSGMIIIWSSPLSSSPEELPLPEACLSVGSHSSSSSSGLFGAGLAAGFGGRCWGGGADDGPASQTLSPLYMLAQHRCVSGRM